MRFQRILNMCFEEEAAFSKRIDDNFVMIVKIIITIITAIIVYCVYFHITQNYSYDSYRNL